MFNFAAALLLTCPSLAKICRKHGAYLIVDAAQSMGSLPIFPEKWGIDAVASSGWKWLLGPLGSALLYTSPVLA